MNDFKHNVTVERTDRSELQRLVKQLDVWCIQHWGFPGPNNFWHRNRNRFYERRGSRWQPRIYYTVYSFKDAGHAFEFKLAHM